MTKDFSITEHKFVPVHETMEDKDVQDLLKKLDVEKSQLPVISSDDPVVKEIGAKKGQVIKITRDSLTAGKAIYYRMVK